ncbi:hypothetical protein ES332_D05G387400v1 [Gossypium tomentosum]|uniref:RING-type domain-containing protein n=1 Tax=Gossypium tomentosum TaxID=34277 RepID=A0A5D2L822_GOSTO|nr:hypothetical protein ES332_D05G387400v1 [Gossypium tomentosum]
MISDLILLLFPTTQLRNQEIPVVKKPKSTMGLKFHLLKPWESGGEFRRGVMSVVDAMWVDIIFTIALLDRKRASNTSDSSSKSSGISYASISTTSSSCNSKTVPPELHCPLCKQVMEDAVLTRCCFSSFCEKCVRDRIVSMATCVCRRQVVADDILPNMTLRDTINRFLNNQSGTETSATKRKLVNAENEDEEQRKKMKKTEQRPVIKAG